MNLERVIAALAPTDVVQRAPVEISDLAYDTRAVGPGALFFCVPGERHDGHAFAREADQWKGKLTRSEWEVPPANLRAFAPGAELDRAR